MAHADIDTARQYVADGALSELASYLARLIEQLAAGGAQIAAVSAVTPHICAPQLAAISPLPLVDIVEATRNEIGARGLRRIALFGTRATMESRMFGRLGDVEVVALRADEVDFVHETYIRLAVEGVAATADYSRLQGLAGIVCERDGVEAVVLAGTDLALVFNEGNTDFPHIDCTRVHVDAIIRRVMEAG